MRGSGIKLSLSRNPNQCIRHPLWKGQECTSAGSRNQLVGSGTHFDRVRNSLWLMIFMFGILYEYINHCHYKKLTFSQNQICFLGFIMEKCHPLFTFCSVHNLHVKSLCEPETSGILSGKISCNTA